MEKQIDLDRLRDFFDAEDIEWKPITISKKTNRGLAAAYLTNRAIMDRLDEVCGPANWRNEFQTGPDGGVICGLSIRVGEDWVTKWDGAENTDIEPVKGGLSSAMRRAAVQWGIGRYLYRLPSQWVPVDERGRFLQQPAIPSAYLPGRSGDGAAAASQEAPVPAPAPQRTAPQRKAQPPQAERRSHPAQPREAPPKAAEAPSKRKPDAADEFFMPKDLPF